MYNNMRKYGRMNRSVIVEGMTRGGYYAHAVISGDYVFISGQTGIDGSKKRDFSSQFKTAMNRLIKISEDTGKSIKDIVKVNVYLKNGSFLSAMNDLFREYFEEILPARTTLITEFVSEDILVEIDAILH